MKQGTRAVQSTAPLSSFNPFSPQKSKSKAHASTSDAGESRPNPFSTPAKHRPHIRLRLSSPASPEDAPGPSSASRMRSLSPSPLPSAVSRARKRLRGEAVSPSPNKDKRRKLTAKPPQRFDSSSDEEMADARAERSFVDDSPVKSSTFRVLFSESTVPKPALLSRLKAASVPSGIFGAKNDSSASASGSGRLQNRSKSTSIFPASGKNSTTEDFLSTADADEHESEAISHQGNTVSVDAAEEVQSLIPPSPPHTPPPQKYKPNAKGKGPAKRKNLLVGSDPDDDEDDEIHWKIKTVPTSQPKRKSSHEDLDFLDEFSHQQAAHDSSLSIPTPDAVEIDLPDQLREILALNMPDEARTDRALVNELMYGRRETHYNAGRGGEIWDVGEDVSSEGQEDWEGEPVPWETGEL